MRFIRLILLAALVYCGAVALIGGCTTSQQTVAVKTLGTVQKITLAANDEYYALVIHGIVKTNGLPAEASLFNKFQASFLIALDAVQYNTNALAPASLQQESTDVINLINILKEK